MTIVICIAGGHFQLSFIAQNLLKSVMFFIPNLVGKRKLMAGSIPDY